MKRLLFTTVLLPFLAGCGNGLGGINATGVNINGSKQATEERNLTAPHMAGSGIDVATGLGSVEIAADPSLKEVKITAKLSANGNTDEEAKQRLADVRIEVERRKDGVLAITAKPKEDGKPIQAACSFIVHVPDANGTKARSGNGSVTLTGLGGKADAHSGMGFVSVTRNMGNVAARSGNGSVVVRDAGGDVTAESGMGAVTVENTAGVVKAKSGNGSVTVVKAAGIDATSSMGAVTVRDSAGDVAATSGNGSVTVAGAKGAVRARSSMGRVSVENAVGKVDAESGNGSVDCLAAGPLNLHSGMGSVHAKLPAGAGGRIKATTSLGSITVNGPRKPKSVTGDRGSKTIVLTDDGPASTLHSGNGSVTVTLE
ncbi:MAG TPA: hypothetical protein VH120_15990 [Gemmataceae bacterium]|nr:hypothetical protein [Gemmataceae bacterium]